MALQTKLATGIKHGTEWQWASGRKAKCECKENNSNENKIKLPSEMEIYSLLYE